MAKQESKTVLPQSPAQAPRSAPQAPNEEFPPGALPVNFKDVADDTPTPRRQVLQIGAQFSPDTGMMHFAALCNDGTIWEYNTPRNGVKAHAQWERLPDVPQP